MFHLVVLYVALLSIQRILYSKCDNRTSTFSNLTSMNKRWEHLITKFIKCVMGVIQKFAHHIKLFCFKHCVVCNAREVFRKLSAI